MSDTNIPNLPPELKEAINLVADNAADKLYTRLMDEANALFWGPAVDEKTRLGLVYLISLRLTSRITKEIQSTPK